MVTFTMPCNFLSMVGFAISVDMNLSISLVFTLVLHGRHVTLGSNKYLTFCKNIHDSEQVWTENSYNNVRSVRGLLSRLYAHFDFFVQTAGPFRSLSIVCGW